MPADVGRRARALTLFRKTRAEQGTDLKQSCDIQKWRDFPIRSNPPRWMAVTFAAACGNGPSST